MNPMYRLCPSLVLGCLVAVARAAAPVPEESATPEPDHPTVSDASDPGQSDFAESDGERARSRERMLDEVDRAWHRPGSVVGLPSHPPRDDTAPMRDKLQRILVPAVNFSGTELDRVVNALSAASEELDQTGTEPRGINLVLVAQEGVMPTVNIALRNLPLKRVLDFITDSVGYQYEIQPDAVVIRPAGGQPVLDTRFFPLSRSTVLRMTGRTGGATAPTPPGEGDSDGAMIRTFLQLAGVDFNGVPGSTLAFDGSQLFVTQSQRNLERIQNILARYHNVRQVEIEAKFMEVQQGALEEIGVQWHLSSHQTTGTPRLTGSTGNGITRTLAEAFRNATNAQEINISSEGGGLTIPSAAPLMPGGVLLAAGAAPLLTYTGVIGEFDVAAVVRALSQRSGTELLSAPKLTVLSGNSATITVAQEFRFPQSYGQIQSQVGTGNLSGGGSAGVSITSGTPQDFATRNVGVELRVTPTVEEDNRSISLDLNPKVTEFEGFVEYGGPSIAISGGTTVTVPPGFYQPIFAVREVATKVTLWDGATLVMGGLTREDVRKIQDKIPILGSMPLIGRFFRTDGETTQKRNLLIFVTASLVTPGGGRMGTEVATAAPRTSDPGPGRVRP
jgi:general secretion pathway protein D